MFGKLLYTNSGGSVLPKGEIQTLQTPIPIPIPIIPIPIPKPSHIKPFLQPYVTPCLSTDWGSTIPPQFFSGSQIKAMYNIPKISKLLSTKQVKIAIIIAYTYPNLKVDLATYWKNPINFGPSSTPPNINIYTMPGATQDSGWAQEECLDVQMVCTVNPNANIWVVEAKSSSCDDLLAAVLYATSTLKADVLSMSWGRSESEFLLMYDSYFNNTSVCYCAASGDTNSVSWPATNPNCISVGGTTIIWNPTVTPPRTEYACDFAGCGYSNLYSQPTYQSDVIKNTFRSIPDLSLIADSNTSVYTVYNNNWYGVGGTSVSTPIFAGMLSLANQQRINAGKCVLTTVSSPTIPTKKNVQTYLYKTIYTNTSLYSSIFYDVKIGTDLGSVAGSDTELTTYSSGAKYDIPTGLGSPNALNLCNALVNL